MSLDDDRLALSYENSIRNFYILDEINKALEKINALNSNQTEEEMKSSTEMAEHYAQKFDELYEALKTRLGIEE
jgi:RPA family protein